MSRESTPQTDSAHPAASFDPALDRLDPQQASDERLSETLASLVQLQNRRSGDSSSGGDTDHATVAAKVSVDDLLARFELGPKLGDEPWAAEFLDDDEALQLPLRIGTLVRIRPIRMGRHAYLCSAFDEDADRLVGIKVPRRHPEGHHFSIRSEIDALKQIADDNVINLRSEIEHDGRTVAVLDWIEGDSLSSLARQKPLNSQEAAVVAAKITAGLTAIHSTGWVHHDVKPDNVMIGRRGALKLVDMGTAGKVGEALHPDQTKSGQTTGDQSGSDQVEYRGRGTLGFMPPEQAGFIHTHDSSHPSADFFSLGMTIVDIVGGTLPNLPAFSDGVPPGNADASKRWEDVIRRAVPGQTDPQLTRLIIELTRLEPSRRLTDANSIREALGILAGPTDITRVYKERRQQRFEVHAPNGSEGVSPDQKAKASNHLGWLAIGLAAASLLAVVWVLLQNRQSEIRHVADRNAAISSSNEAMVTKPAVDSATSSQLATTEAVERLAGVWSVESMDGAPSSEPSVRIVINQRDFYWIEGDLVAAVATLGAVEIGEEDSGLPSSMLLKMRATREPTELVRCEIRQKDGKMVLSFGTDSAGGRKLVIQASGPARLRDFANRGSDQLRATLAMISQDSEFTIRQRNKRYRTGYRPPWPFGDRE